MGEALYTKSFITFLIMVKKEKEYKNKLFKNG